MPEVSIVHQRIHLYTIITVSLCNIFYMIECISDILYGKKISDICGCEKLGVYVNIYCLKQCCRPFCLFGYCTCLARRCSICSFHRWLALLFYVDFHIIICNRYFHSLFYMYILFCRVKLDLILLQHQLEKLMESRSKKKAEIASMLEMTSQVKQMKENLSQSMSLVCRSWEVLVLLFPFVKCFQEEILLLQLGKSFQFSGLPFYIMPVYPFSFFLMLVILIVGQVYFLYQDYFVLYLLEESGE